MTTGIKDTIYEDMDILVMQQFRLGLRTLEETIHYFESKGTMCFCCDEFSF